MAFHPGFAGQDVMRISGSCSAVTLETRSVKRPGDAGEPWGVESINLSWEFPMVVGIDSSTL